MVESVFSYVLENWPMLALVIILVAAVAWITYKATKAFNRLEKIEEKYSNLPCEGHSASLKEVDSRMATHNATLEAIKTDVSIIKASLMSNNHQASLFAVKHSPAQLNDLGNELFGKFHCQKFLDENGTRLISLIEEKSPKTPLDVENFALEVLFLASETPAFDTLKTDIYNSPAIEVPWGEGTKQYTITIKDIVYIIGLVLRNMYFEKHKEIPQE